MNHLTSTREIRPGIYILAIPPPLWGGIFAQSENREEFERGLEKEKEKGEKKKKRKE